MKLIKIIFILFLASNLYAYTGDNLGNHKARKNLNMNNHDIQNVDGIKMDSADVLRLYDNLGNVFATITPTSMTFNINGYVVYAATGIFPLVRVSTVQGDSPIVLQADKVDVANGGLAVRNGGTGLAQNWIPLGGYDKLAMAISSGNLVDAPSNNVNDETYSHAVSSDGRMKIMQILWGDGTIQNTAPSAAPGSAATISSTTISVISSENDIFIASTVYNSSGLMLTLDTTFYATSIRYYVSGSTTGSCFFTIFKSTTNDNTNVFTTPLSVIEVSTNTHWCNWQSIDSAIEHNDRWYLAIINAPVTLGGNLPNEYGFQVRGWYYLKQE